MDAEAEEAADVREEEEGAEEEESPSEEAAEPEEKKGYVYGFFDLKDPDEFNELYSPMAEATLEPYGGKCILTHALPPPMAEKMGMKEDNIYGVQI